MPLKQALAAEVLLSVNRGSLLPITLAQNISKLSLNEVARTLIPPVIIIRELFILSFNEEDTSSDLSLNDNILNGLNFIFKRKELTIFNKEALKFKGFMV